MGCVFAAARVAFIGGTAALRVLNNIIVFAQIPLPYPNNARSLLLLRVLARVCVVRSCHTGHHTAARSFARTRAPCVLRFASSSSIFAFNTFWTRFARARASALSDAGRFSHLYSVSILYLLLALYLFCRAFRLLLPPRCSDRYRALSSLICFLIKYHLPPFLSSSSAGACHTSLCASSLFLRARGVVYLVRQVVSHSSSYGVFAFLFARVSRARMMFLPLRARTCACVIPSTMMRYFARALSYPLRYLQHLWRAALRARVLRFAPRARLSSMLWCRFCIYRTVLFAFRPHLNVCCCSASYRLRGITCSSVYFCQLPPSGTYSCCVFGRAHLPSYHSGDHRLAVFKTPFLSPSSSRFVVVALGFVHFRARTPHQHRAFSVCVAYIRLSRKSIVLAPPRRCLINLDNVPSSPGLPRIISRIFKHVFARARFALCYLPILSPS